MWESNVGGTVACRALMAALKASQDFVCALATGQREISFCEAHENVSFHWQVKMVCKSFHDTKRRPNLDLIQEFVGPNAEKVSFGELGSYIPMEFVGDVLPASHESDCCRFVEVAKELHRLHEK